MIISNQVRCLKCHDEIYSAHRHDFKWCSCGNIAVDGGMDYLRRVGASTDTYEDMSITIDDKVYKQIKKAVEWSKDTGRNDLGLICAIFRVLRDNGLLKDV